MDLSNLFGDDTPPQLDELDFIRSCVEYITSFLYWFFLSNVYIKNLLVLVKPWVIQFYLIVRAGFVNCRYCFEVVCLYVLDNYPVWIESALILIAMFLVSGITTYVYYSQFRGVTIIRTLGNERRRVLIAIAHPIDVVLFFGPSILEMKDSCDVKILCFSTGKYTSIFFQVILA